MDISRGCYWIGYPGNLYPVGDNVGEVGLEHDDEPKITRILGGGISARVNRTRANRTWAVTIPDAEVDDVTNLQALLALGIPSGYAWVTPFAQVTNVLTPEQSMLRSSSPALALSGAWPIADTGGQKFAIATRLNPSAAFGNIAPVTVGPCPIPPWWAGRKVTVSSYLATARPQGAYVVLQWLNAAGAPMGTPVQGNAVTGMDGVRRSVATGTPPPGAASCRWTNNYAEVIAQPAGTWTDSPTTWGVGGGAQRVLVHGLRESIGEWAVANDQSRIREDVSFIVLETGPLT
ncbi:hypothetical protein [Janibacter melonis]|uniref:hypothetical protein n=1 Tax=Janibacter melonis TaxID=262209 RepID=UPI00174B1DAE|nr:hypothetical protein [Janibacter melonis]